MIHSIAQCVSYLTKGFLNFPSFHILPLRLWVEFWVGMKVGILASHILLSQRPDHKEMQVIHFDQDMRVCGIRFLILNIFCTPLYRDSLFWMNAFWKVWAIFISFLFSLLFFRQASKYPLFYSLDICPFFLSCPLAWIFSFLA
jgi:hypothetical protein